MVDGHLLTNRTTMLSWLENIHMSVHVKNERSVDENIVLKEWRLDGVLNV